MTGARRDRGGLVGEGLFETLLVLAGAAPHLAAHLARARGSAAALGLDWFVEPAGLADAIQAGWEGCGRPARAAARLTFTVGGPPGLAPATAGAATTDVAVRPLPDRADRTPWRAVTVAAHRVDPGARVSGHKTLSWLPWVLARREARERGADVGIVCTVDGDPCEADHANLFVVRDGTVVTPPLSRGVLPGITRRRVLRTLAEGGRPVSEAPLRPDDLRRASEVFVTSSLDGVRAVGEIDGTTLAAPGPIAAWLDDCVPVA